ncbi:AAA family ATPase [Streptomyces bikiniensis]|uniref:AAA family ATPase n=1 Tax=Streptomyces bikiniensis TaxID=1896 RepID=A0ABW8CXE0_STRBI
MDGDEQPLRNRGHGHDHDDPNPRPDRGRTGPAGDPRGGPVPDVHGRPPGEDDDGVATTSGSSKRSGGRTPHDPNSGEPRDAVPGVVCCFPRTGGTSSPGLAGGSHLASHAPAVRVPTGLVVLVGPPASGKTSFVRALIARRQIDAEAVVSTDEIRAEFFGTSPAEAESDAADALIFQERDRRIVARLAAGHSAVAESTNVTPRARARLVALAGRFDAPVTVLRFAPDVADLLQQHTERGRTDLTAADVRAYAAVMAREAGADQLRSEGATAVHDVPGRREAITPSEAAARFSFA